MQFIPADQGIPLNVIRCAINSIRADPRQRLSLIALAQTPPQNGCGHRENPRGLATILISAHGRASSSRAICVFHGYLPSRALIGHTVLKSVAPERGGRHRG
jgi:hypothetical protein